MGTGALFALFFLAPACSSSPECNFSNDCPSGLNCEEGKCVMPTGGHVSHPDATVVVHPDATAMDAEMDATPGLDVDSGITPADGGDAMTVDAADAAMAGPFDAGDGGPVDATVLPSGGLLWYGELATSMGATEFHDVADVFDRSMATYAQSAQRFNDTEGTSCLVTATHLLSGTPAGLSAMEIVFEHSPAAGNPSRSLMPDPAQPGHFIPAMPPSSGFFNNTASLVRVVKNGTAGQLSDHTAFLADPNLFLQATMPVPGMPVSLAMGIHLMWSTAHFGAPIVVELYDATREVVMRCEILDDQMYDVPSGAISAYLAANPAAPSTLELRYDVDVMTNLPLEPPPPVASVPGVVRLSRGQRWTAQ